MSMRRGWGLGCAVLGLVAACSSPPRPSGLLDSGVDVPIDRPTAAAETAVDAGVDAGTSGCGIGPHFDLDFDGFATPEGDALWVDFSRSSDAPQITPIATCGGPVYNAVVVKWTAPRAGIMRLRVERDQSDWASEMLASAYLSARRLETCAWDATARDCSVATFEGDPSHTRSEFEFPVQAGPQLIALAWSFNYGAAGVRVTPVPALRVSASMINQTGYGRVCVAGADSWDALCPARSDCLAVAGAAPACVPRGARGGVCRGPLRDCDGTLVCLALGNNCEAPAAVGESCENRGCAPGSSCLVRMPVSESRCVAEGALGGACRASSDPRAGCDTGLACRAVATRLTCVQEVAIGMACTEETVCAGTAVCAPNRAGAGSVCTAAGAEGTNCTATTGQPSPCATGLRCIDRFCRSTHAAGEACEMALEDRDCEAGLACVDGRCAAPPAGRCTVRGDRCPDGQRCVNRMCVTAIAPGETCTGGTCAGGYTCPSDVGRCEVGIPSAGCTDDADCVRGTACREHLCVVVGQCPQRNVIRNDVVCDTNARCIPVTGSGLACRPIGRDGGVCRPGATPCEAGHRCVGGICVTAADASAGVCPQRLRCPPGARCEAGCQLTGTVGTEGARCRRARNAAGECDRPLRCDLATLTCVR